METKGFDKADILNIEKFARKMNPSSGRIESDGEHVNPPISAVGISLRYFHIIHSTLQIPTCFFLSFSYQHLKPYAEEYDGGVW